MGTTVGNYRQYYPSLADLKITDSTSNYTYFGSTPICHANIAYHHTAQASQLECPQGHTPHSITGIIIPALIRLTPSICTCEYFEGPCGSIDTLLAHVEIFLYHIHVSLTFIKLPQFVSGIEAFKISHLTHTYSLALNKSGSQENSVLLSGPGFCYFLCH
jgi:hypothetical protein